MNKRPGRKTTPAMVKQVNAALNLSMWETSGRTAILAMRDPNPAMLDAGYAAACQHDTGDTVPFTSISIAVWQAMIDEALK
jgi:hypothetical protein